jgi:hypothetical protein
MNRRRQQPDGIREYVEWTDHQYDPGYYTGGRIPPYYLGKRPNRFGCVLVIEGVVSLVAFAIILTQVYGQPLWPSRAPISQIVGEGIIFFIGAIVLASLVFLPLIAGIKLLMPESKRRSRKDSSQP